VNLEYRESNELTIRDLFNIFRKRRTLVYGTVVVLGVLGVLYCAVCTRRYEATGTVQIQKESSDGLGLDSLMSDAGGASDALEANIIIQTQANILQSDTLALRTIENLHMEGTEDFRSHWNPFGWLLEKISPRGLSDAPGVSLENAPERRRRALKTFAKNLTVKPVSGTRLIEIDYLNPDPKLAAAVVNELMQGLVDYNFQTRYNATNQASTWLTGQLTELRKQSEELQGKVVDLERKSGVYSLGTVDAQGREQAYSGVLDQLQQSTVALTQAQQNRIIKGGIAQAAETGNPEMLSGLAGNTVSGPGGSQSMNNALGLIQNLRQQESAQQAALQEAEAKYGASYPKIAEMRANLEGLDRSIHDEVDRVKKRAESDYAIAVEAEKNTRAQYDKAKVEADRLNDKAIEYTILRQEADESRGLYEDLLRRLKEAGVLEGLKSSNITVVDPGRIPSRPKKPNIPLYMAGALTGGFLLGCLGALLVDALDNKVGNLREIEELTGTTLLGALPLIGDAPVQSDGAGRTALATLNDPNSTYAEAARAIRTAVLLTGGADSSRVILVTSSIPGEGKTTLSANLAVVLAQSNRRVLLVDLDMRRGSLRQKMQLPHTSGLSELLSGHKKEPQVAQVKGLSRLDILLAGAKPPNPSELLDSKVKEWLDVWRRQYDFIILDAPPLLPVTDAQIVHPLVDITLLLARSGVTERPQLQRSHRMLTNTSNHYVGVILNGLRPQDESYYGYYGYRNYSYNYGKDGHEISV
jgi:polysaccharide biosynthesis transport protein